MIRTRFAPSPTGNLHLGHAYSAITAYNFAKEQDGKFLLRIEDIDPTRCKDEFTNDIYEDLAWLGLTWETPVRKQSEHYDDYFQNIKKLREMGVLYACICTRKDIQEEVARSGYAPHGPEGAIYPGTCRHKNLNTDDIDSSYALRLNLETALGYLKGKQLYWQDKDGEFCIVEPKELGDVVLARKDIGTSYHLSVVSDDALQGITHIVRGEDLKYATHIHRILQELLGFTQPEYFHHELLTDKTGRRFAKRDKSQTLKSLKQKGKKPDDIYNLIGLKPL